MSDLPQSSRSKPSLPSDLLDARHPLIVFDGVCLVLLGLRAPVVRLDRKAATASPPLGEPLFRKHDLPTDNYETNLAIAAAASLRSCLALA